MFSVCAEDQSRFSHLHLNSLSTDGEDGAFWNKDPSGGWELAPTLRAPHHRRATKHIRYAGWELARTMVTMAQIVIWAIVPVCASNPSEVLAGDRCQSAL